jgi:rod shape-determining protein MreD
MAQLVLLKHLPPFARTCDLILLFVAALAVSRHTGLVLAYALAAGMLVDSLSISYPLLHTIFYPGAAVLLSLRRPYTYLSHTSLFVVTVAGLIVGKIVFAYIWTLLFVRPISPVMLFRVSLSGIVILLLLAQFAGRRLLLALKEPEVLDVDVEH